MKQNNFLIALGLIILLNSPFVLFAQEDEKALEAERKAISEVVRGFTKAFSEVSETGDKTSVLKYFDPNFTSDLTYVRIGDVVRNTSGNYERLNAQLENLINSKDMKVTYEIQEITKHSIKSTIAVVPFINNFEVRQGDDLLMVGSQIFTFTMRKTGGEWRVVHYAVTEIEDQRHKGACICELFEEQKRNVDMVSKTTFPSGSDYKTELDEFAFRRVENGTLILLRTGKNTYYLWDRNKVVHVLDENEKPVKELGKAKDSSEAVLLILQGHIYADNCLRIVRKR
ncbi:MAG: hypothetical protein JJT94_11435 [Bernardetiaceae bacterium]|nr:hypothetical protein [Bernardetiaceae bacterium]